MLKRIQNWLGSTVLAFAGCAFHQAVPPLEVGQTVPSFQLASATDNHTMTSDSLEGEVIVLNFWSTSCAVCLQEVKHLEAIHQSGKAKVIGIALDEDRQRVQNIIEKQGIKYPVLIGDQDTFERFDGISIPYNLVLDRSKVVRKRFYGPMSEDDLDEVLQSIESPNRVAMRDN
jgi:peroxiredoxin